MASRIGLIRAVLNLDSAGFRQGLERAQSASERFQKKMRRMEYRMKRFGRKMENIGQSMTMGITLPIIGAAGAAVKSAADFEALGVQMEVLAGSVEEGRKAFENLKRFSARTPFQLKDLTKAQQTLMGFGESTEDAFQHLQMLGDIVAVTGGDLQAVTVAFGQAAAEGQLLSRDIRQLTNQGVPALKLLAESMGVAKSEIFDLASQGEITFDVLVEAFRKATSEGGKFHRGTERLAGTLKGVFSTLKDDVAQALAELGETISDTLNLKRIAKNVSTQLQRITKAFQAMSEDGRTQILKIAGLLAAGGPMMFVIGKLAQAIAGLSKFIRSRFIVIAGSFALGVSGGQWLIDNWEVIEKTWKNIMDSFVIAAQKMTRGVLQAIEKLLNAFDFKTLDELFGTELDLPDQSDTSKIEKAINSLTDNITSNTEELTDRIGEVNKMDLTSFSESAQNGFEKITDSLSGLLDMVYGGSSLEEFINMLNQPLPDFGGGSSGASSTGGSDSSAWVSSSFQQTWDNLDKLIAQGQKLASVSENAGGKIDESFSNASHTMQMLGDVMGNVVGQLSKGAEEAVKFETAMRSLIPKILSHVLFPDGGFGAGLVEGFFGGVFHQGGVVPGPVGQERLILAQGGETVLTPEQMRKGFSGGSQSISIPVYLDGKKIFENQKEVQHKVDR